MTKGLKEYKNTLEKNRQEDKIKFIQKYIKMRKGRFKGVMRSGRGKGGRRRNRGRN
jgi:glutathione synthase/RimK-type ligase-like ATP-grasp enzyme